MVWMAGVSWLELRDFSSPKVIVGLLRILVLDSGGARVLVGVDAVSVWLMSLELKLL